MFHVKLYSAPDKHEELGTVKILQRGKKATELEPRFTELPPGACSLGQGREYYETLERAGDLGESILRSLRDVVFLPSVREEFEMLEGFNTSLLRFSEATSNLKDAGELFGLATDGRAKRRQFTFEHQVEAFSVPHRVRLDFRARSGLPHRIIVFVGRNGTGKTAVMAEMARQSAGISKLKRNGFSGGRRPDFSRTVVISYSPFGPFRYPPVHTSSYRYCGVLDVDGRMSAARLDTHWVEAIETIRKLDRVGLWHEAMKVAGLFASEPLLEEITWDAAPQQVYSMFRRMSSGHFAAASVLTDAVVNLRPDSLALIDEPELYLHPNMVSGLMRALDWLLEELDSFAIIATHSPIVVQEIPARSVRVFKRTGGEPRCVELDFESFGENLTTIVTRVFEASHEDKNYTHILRDLSHDRTPTQVDQLFNGGLGLNAMSYLEALSGQDDDLDDDDAEENGD